MLMQMFNSWKLESLEPRLDRIVQQQAANGDYSSAVRAAFVHLEQRIRQTAGLAAHDFGKDLIDKAFHPQTGRLQPVSPVSAECAGLHHLLLGLFLFYRNPIAHRPISYNEQSAKPILQLIDHALHLVKVAAESAFDIADFVGIHEGQILRRRDYRLDIDADGELEVVVLLQLGARSDGTEMKEHLLPVIIKKTQQGYRRIPAEGVSGYSMYGAAGVEVRHITNATLPDVIVSWFSGETAVFSIILRKLNDQYVIAKRDIAGLTEPYNGPAENGFNIHGRQELSFADVDGDGLMEMIQGLGFDSEEIPALGYQAEMGSYVSRLLKWDAMQDRIVKIDERLVVIDHQRREEYEGIDSE